MYGLGIAHCSPFHWEMPPDTETQKVAETQEIDETDPQSPLVPCHDWPSEAKAFPPNPPTRSTRWEHSPPHRARWPPPPWSERTSSAVPADDLVPAVATAMHSDGLAHDTDTAPGPSGCGAAGTGPLHPNPPSGRHGPTRRARMQDVLLPQDTDDSAVPGETACAAAKRRGEPSEAGAVVGVA